MTDALRVCERSLAALEAWITANPEQERWFDVTADDSDKPFIVILYSKGSDQVRGHTLLDALAQAAQVILLNPELES